MAQATETVPVRRIPRQPECNIGTSGHVDHGKCLDPSEYVLLNGRLKTGYEILESLAERARLLKTTDGYSVYELDESLVVSIDSSLKPCESKSILYVQKYSGPMYRILTDSGRSISVTPEHPLLTSRAGSIEWIRARDLKGTDHVAFLSRVPLSNPAVFPDPLPALRKDFDIVEYDDYSRLRRGSEDFTNLSVFGLAEVNLMRILTGLSVTRLARLARIDRTRLGKLLSSQLNPTLQQMKRLREALALQSVRALKPGEFIASAKGRGRWSSRRLGNPDMDIELAKWFAFVWSEGTSTPTKISVTQSVQMRMLNEFFLITESKFAQKFRKTGDIDYQINSKAFLRLLEEKYSYRPGSEDTCGVADWVLGLSPEMKAAFLRWFFTLDGEFNFKSGQIMISQRNKRNIVILGYLLQSLGIVPRFSETSQETKKGTIRYARLMISGRTNLQAFADAIGFEDPRIRDKLGRYLLKINPSSKDTDLSLPVGIHELEQLLFASGLVSEGYHDVESPMKQQSWYGAYSALRASGRISRSKLLAVLSAAGARLEEIEYSLECGRPDSGWILNHMGLAKLSRQRIADEAHLTRKKLSIRLGRADKSELEAIYRVVQRVSKENLSISRAVLAQYHMIAKSPLEFDKVRSVEVTEYTGEIFDLSVPSHANFIAGTGAILAHNTSLVAAITGVWASAHSEELKRGITIKVGYADAAFYKCAHTPPPEAYSTSPVCPVCGQETQLLRTVSFVDSPGHESLMTNMLAGAAVMDGAILVIAANEPVPMPQTREHMLALQMLGMKKMVIVQNKIDRVDVDGARKNYDAIKTFLSGTVAADAPIIPVSAQHSINIDALIEAIEQNIPTPHRDSAADAQLVVLRSFDVNKPGAEITSLVGGVLGGSVTKGELKVGDEVEIAPGLVDDRGKYSPLITKIASLGTGVGMADKVGPGGLVSVGTFLDPSLTKGDLMVGSLIGKPGSLPPAKTHITTDLQLFEQAVGSAEMLKVDKVKPGESLRLNIGTAATLGTVTSARDSVAEMDLRKPVVAEKGSRVAISRRIAERWRLIGSGLVR